ncbi:MAG: glycosyl hydrolase family 2, partial [Gemmatimonadaceae bacterium]|nr:glycosyl hydrolase family 2 [Gemmatimonadaceae bacterium]
PALAGIDRDRLFLWSDFTAWNETKPGFPQVYPVTRGFVFTRPESLSNVQVLANYDHGLEGIALAELFNGRGSVMVTGFDLVNRSGIDPIADRMLANVVRHMGTNAPHDPVPSVTARIDWGDYASEHGLLTGIYSGLIVHTVPTVPADLTAKYPVTMSSEGFAYGGGSGGWNTKPAIQYVARGRRPFGPYKFTSGGSVKTLQAGAGEGRVWLRVPASRTEMQTVVANATHEPLVLEITVNGVTQNSAIAADGSTTVTTPVRGGDVPLALTYRGDRRLVLLSTDFR